MRANIGKSRSWNTNYTFSLTNPAMFLGWLYCEAGRAVFHSVWLDATTRFNMRFRNAQNRTR
jgi:hypothetical protein